MIYLAATRFKDKSKRVYEVSDADSNEDARKALLDVGATCALVLVPKTAEVFVMEPQTA